jgi:hypothetical protein
MIERKSEYADDPPENFCWIDHPSGGLTRIYSSRLAALAAGAEPETEAEKLLVAKSERSRTNWGHAIGEDCITVILGEPRPQEQRERLLGEWERRWVLSDEE